MKVLINLRHKRQGTKSKNNMQNKKDCLKLRKSNRTINNQHFMNKLHT